ncbi:MAG: hypothetical protein AAF600_04635 [Bacteroidota bacterium]
MDTKKELEKAISEIDEIKFDKSTIEIQKTTEERTILISQTSDSVGFRAFDIEYNEVYIRSIFNLLKQLNSISNDLSIMRSFSEKDFYESFTNCGCTSAPTKIIDAYQKSWESISTSIDEVQLPSKSLSTEQVLRLEELIDNVKSKIGRVDQKKIKTKIKSPNTKKLIKYISRDNIPSNSLEIIELYNSIENLKGGIISFLTYVNILN